MRDGDCLSGLCANGEGSDKGPPTFSCQLARPRYSDKSASLPSSKSAPPFPASNKSAPLPLFALGLATCSGWDTENDVPVDCGEIQTRPTTTVDTASDTNTTDHHRKVKKRRRTRRTRTRRL
jgi:hypothetical protein